MAKRKTTIDRLNSRPIHENLRSIRVERGLSQEELGAKLGKHRTVICHWECGPNAPKLDDLAGLADALKTTIDRLVR